MNDSLIDAETALMHGEYRKCLLLLEPLIKSNPLTAKEGAQIRMLLVTAYMGKGDNEKAIKTCRILTKCRDEEIRKNAKQLLPILEAPSLPRPKNWSIILPKIGIENVGDSDFRSTSRKRFVIDKGTKIDPPTGPTKSPQAGFIIIVLIVITGLTFLLSN